jgi:P4 family phage/plasmid primase-like protien
MSSDNSTNKEEQSVQEKVLERIEQVDYEQVPIFLARRVIQENPTLKVNGEGVFYLYKKEVGCYQQLEIQGDRGIRDVVFESLLRNGNYKKIRKHTIGEIIMCLQYDKKIRCDSMDADPNLIALKNGVFNLKTKELYDPSPKYKVSKLIEIEYDKDADCPTFDNFLNSVFNGDQEHIKNILRLGGYALSNVHPSEVEKMFLFLGEGSNGKSVLIRVLQTLFHQSQQSSLSIEQLTTDNFKRVDLSTSRVNFCTEMNANQRIKNDGELKRIISGEWLTIDRKFAPPMSIRVQSIIIMASNSMPQTSDSTYAMARRMVVFPFKNTYLPHKKYQKELMATGNSPDYLAARGRYVKDPTLIHKIMEELPGVFNRMIEGYDEFCQAGYSFVESDSTYDEVMEDLRGADPEYVFITTECNWSNDTEDFVHIDSIYAFYRSWYIDNWSQKASNIASKQRFIKKITSLFPEDLQKSRRRTPSGQRKYVYNIIPIASMNPAAYQQADTDAFEEVRALFEDYDL